MSVFLCPKPRKKMYVRYTRLQQQTVKWRFPGGKYNAEGGRGKCVSICISKHGICTPKSPLVCVFAPKTPVLKGEKNNESKYK